MRLTYRRLRSSIVTLWNRALEWLKSRVGELARFGVVGAAGVVVNLGVFNALRLGPLSAESTIAGDDDRVVNAGRADLLHHADDRLRRYGDHGEIGRRGEVGDRGVNRDAVDLGNEGIDEGDPVLTESGEVSGKH